MSLPSERIRPIDFGHALATGMALRNQRDQRDVNQWQFQRAQEDYARQQKAREAYEAGDFETYARYDPQGALKLQQTRAEMRKQALETQKLEREGVDATEKNTLEMQQRLLSAAKAGADIGNLRRLRDEAVTRKRVNMFELPGDGDAFADVVPDSPDQRQRQIAQLERTAGVEDPYAKPTGDMVEAEYAKTHPEFDERQLALARARRSVTNVNVGGRNLAAGEVNELSDLDSAMQSVDAIFEDFKTTVPNKGTANQVRARLMALIPNTAESQYKNDVNVTKQVVGKKLEGGKLAAGDEKKYEPFFPQPGDSLETAERKKKALKAQLIRDSQSRRAGLKGAGFKVPGSTQPGARTADTDALMDDLLRGQ
jgi:hypothetical protein